MCGTQTTVVTRVEFGNAPSKVCQIFGIQYDYKYEYYVGTFWHPYTWSYHECYAFGNTGPYYTWWEWLDALKKRDMARYDAFIAMVKERNAKRQERKNENTH